MNISFDDLIPTPEGDAGGEAASAVAPLAGGRAPREAREAEPTEAQKKAAAEEWARGVRARQSGLGAYGETFGRGVARAVPFSHQIGSAFDYALGTGVGEGQSSYEDTLRRQRAMSAVDDESRFKTGLAGQLVGGAALPTAGLAAQGVKGAAALGAGYGALHGAAEGESLPDAAGKALVGGGLGAAFGAGVGAAAPYVAEAAHHIASPIQKGIGALVERFSPKAPGVAEAAPALASATARDEVVDAAARLGIDVPKFIASNNRPLQQAAQIARNVPIAGKPVIESTRKLAEDLGEAVVKSADNLGAVSQHEAGSASRRGFDAWNESQKKAIASAYDAVDSLVDPTLSVPLGKTAAIISDLAEQRIAAGLPPNGGASAVVLQAVSRPEGLTYQGLKFLRSYVGKLMDDKPALAAQSVSQAELRRIYGALSDDLKNTVDTVGGDAARKALLEANALNARVAGVRDRLEPLLSGASDESVIAKLSSAARSSGRPDIELLTEAKRALSTSEGAWDSIAGSMLSGLGRDAEGAFSPQRFVTAFGRITPEAKSILFPGQIGKNLEDIARVASRSAETYRMFGNPSGTGQQVIGGSILGGVFLEPITTIASVGGSALIARVLSRPAAISKAAQWAREAEAAAAAAASGKPSDQKALTARIVEFARSIDIPPDEFRKAAIRVAGAQGARLGAGPPPPLPKVAGAEGGEPDDNPSLAGTFGRAIQLGARRAAHEVAQTATASVKGLEGVKDWQEPKDPAIDRISEQGWMSGITDPRWYAAKVGEGIGGSSPSIAGGVVGAGVGSAVAPGVGTVVGGAGGAAMMAAVQALAPAYARARAAGMSHDAAVNVAMGETAISGTAGAAGAVAPFFRVAKGPISNLLAQLFVVQPGIGSAEQVARGAVSGRGITAEELIGGYVSNAGAGAAMHGGMSAAHRAFGRGAPPTPPSSLPGPSGGPPGPRPGNPPTPAAQPSPPSPNPAARAAGAAAVDRALRAHEAGARAVADALAPPPLSSSGAASGAMAAGVRPPATVQATPNTFAAAIRQQAASSQVPGYDPRQVRPPAERGQPAGVFTFDAAALATDAARFQYKADGDGQGVLSGGEGLKSVSKWDRTKAGQILVYEDHDGQTYVVDGHQRAGLARRIKDADPQAQTPITGLLLRSRDGITATQARTIAALKNIAEGSGTLIDAAKIFRDQPGALDDGSLARGRERIQDIEGLARLGPEAFGMVVNDVVPPVYGSLVGRIIPSDTARQDAAMRLLAKADPSTADEARALVRQVAQEDVTTTQEGDLFGGRDIAESLVLEKARVLAQAQRALGRERSTFGTLVKDATRIEGDGNTLAPDANAARRAEAEALATRIDAEAFRKGIVSDALSRAAEGHKAGWSARDAAERFVSAVRSGDVSSLAVDRDAGGGGERGAEAARPPRPVRGEKPAGEVAPAARTPASPPAIEATPAGPQTIIPGAEKAPGAKLAQMGADAPLKPKAPQKDDDGLPLMNDSGKQGDLVDAIKSAPRPDEASAPRPAPEAPPATPEPLTDDQSGGAKPGIETRVVEKDGATETIKLLPPGTILGGNALDARMWRVDERGVKGSIVTPLKVTRFDTEAEAREFFNARIKHYEDYEKPAKQPERMLIGKNRDGHPLLQDDRGVRSYVVDGLRVTESVKLGPDGEPMVDEKARHPDYLLHDEIEDASAGNGKDDNPPEMGKKGDKNSAADFSPPKTAEKPPAADAEPANPATGTKSDAVASPSAEPQPVAWADAKPGDKTTEQDAPSKRLASKGEGLSPSVSVDVGNTTINYVLHAPDINSKSPIMRRMWSVMHSPDKIKLPSDIKISFFESDIEAKRFIDRHAKAFSASGGKINYIDIENAKPGDVLFSGDTLVRSNIARKADAVDIAAKAPPGRVRGVIGDGVGRWAVTEREGLTGAQAWARQRAALVEQGRKAHAEGVSRDDYSRDLDHDGRTAWFQGWDEAATIKNAEAEAAAGDFRPPYPEPADGDHSRAARDWVIESGKRKGDEVYVALGNDGKPFDASPESQHNSSSFVQFSDVLSKAIDDPNERVVAHHNHPLSSPTSMGDIAQLLSRPGLDVIYAHGHDGSYFRIESKRRPATATEISALRLLDSLHTRFSIKEISRNHIGTPKEDLAKIHINSYNVALDQLGIIDYRYKSERIASLLADEANNKFHQDLVDNFKSMVERNGTLRDLVETDDRRAVDLQRPGDLAEVRSRDGDGPSGRPGSDRSEAAGKARDRDEGAGGRSPPDVVSAFDPKASPADAVAAHLAKGEGFSTIVQARKFIDESGGKGLSLKQVDEAIEHGVVKVARQIVASDPAPLAVYDKLVNLYNRQPRLGVRTSESVEQQAYSTPAPLAYIASRAAGIDATKTVYEPSAGNGMLLIGADPAKVKANELNGARAAVLRQQGFKVTQFDASKPGTARSAGTNDAVIANPPFGAVRDETGSVRRFDMSDIQRGYSTNEIDHVIALRSLGAMANDGRAVLILGSVAKTAQSPEARSDAYNGKAKREFFKTLYDRYNVVDHYTVSGDLYDRQGAAWPVDVVVIEGRGKSTRRLPAADPPEMFDTWDRLKAKLDVVAPESSRTPPPRSGEQPGSQTPVDAGDRSPVGDAGNSRPVGTLRGSGRDGNAERPAQDVRGKPDREPIPVGDERRPVAEAGGPLPGDREPAGSGAVPAADRGDSVQLVTPKPIEDAATQAPYEPKASGVPSFKVLTPVNMRDATAGALTKLVDRRGDVAEYAAKATGMSRAELSKVLMAEQIDALALALDNIERGSAFIIGDQTGIGKGRVNAMVIRHAINKGMTPIFVTEKPNLYNDMWRDMLDVGIEKMLGRAPRVLMTNSAERVSVGEGDSASTLLPLDGGGKKHDAALSAIARGDRPIDADVVFTTYNQMQTVKQGETARRDFLRSIADNAIVIFDESHNAGGEAKNDFDVDVKGAPKAPNRAEFARDLAQRAKGVFFSSATFAKNPDVMDLYGRTDMRLAVKSLDHLSEAIRAGGVPLQEVISAMLAQAGQYIRRERSFEGIAYDTPIVPFDHKAYDSFASALAAVHEFSRAMKLATKELSQQIKQDAAAISHDGSTGGAGAESTNFTSIMHNVINQMILAAKADRAADMAIEAIRRGEKPVLTVSQTMESFLNHYAAAAGVGPGMPMTGSFRDVLRRYLERTREVRIRKPFSKEKAIVKYLSDQELGPIGRAAFKRALSVIADMDDSGLPLSPIDHVRQKIADAGYSVGEITGRTMTIDYSGGASILKARPAAEMAILGRQKVIADFNSGALDAVILNRAGSTGLSLHAGEKFKDKRKRHMMILQPEDNVDTHMQVLGRVNRSGQVNLPMYSQMTLDVPAERRPAAILAKKMASLNAATTSSRKGALSSDTAVDFMNSYGDIVATRWIAENPESAYALDLGLIEDVEAKGSYDGRMRKLTGRVPLLKIEKQTAVYADLVDNYQTLIREKNEAGENALEARFLPLDAKVVDSTQVVAGKGGDSPFAAPVYAETINVKRLRPTTNAAQATEAVADHVRVSKDSGMPAIRAAGIRKMEGTKRAALDAFESFMKAETDKAEEGVARDKARSRLSSMRDQWIDSADKLLPGSYVTIIDADGQRTGLVISFAREGKAKNPIALGSWAAKIVTPGDGIEFISLSRLAPDENGEARVTVRKAHYQDDADFMSLLDSMSKEGRQNRVMLTGNMLAAFSYASGRGQIIRYSTATGERAQGVLLPSIFKTAAEYAASRPTPVTTVEGIFDAVKSSMAESITSVDGVVTVGKIGSEWFIYVPASKQKGGKFFLDQRLRGVVGDFVSRGGKMVARPGKQADMGKAFAILLDLGVVFEKRPAASPKGN